MAAAAMVVAFGFSISSWAAIIAAYFAYRSVTLDGKVSVSRSEFVSFALVLIAVLALGSLLSNFSAYAEGVRTGFDVSALSS